ncbi:isocitrate/isopropylmalate dehydrogenase family protein, partial [Pseudomonas syringae pv. tagetis]
VMLENLGYAAEAACITRAVILFSQSHIRTYDLGGSHTTEQVGEAIVRQCIELQAGSYGYHTGHASVQGERHVSAL